MEFLYWLGSLHNPVCDFLFRWITELGGETIFMVVAIAVFWCINKKWGYYIFMTGFLGTLVNQLLKLIFRIPRPWVLAAEAGRSYYVTPEMGVKLDATGYSFPSGHSQNAVATVGGLALCARKSWPKWLIAILIAVAVLVPFSRMYLGVHTPLDVGVGVAGALVVLALCYPFVIKSDKHPKRMLALFCILLAGCAAYICVVNFVMKPEQFGKTELDAASAQVQLMEENGDKDAYPEEYADAVNQRDVLQQNYNNYEDGVKNGWSLTGALLGLLLTYIYDKRYLHFEVKAPIVGQLLKLVLGVGLVIGIRLGLSVIFKAVFPGQLFWNLPRYFMMTFFAGCIWPHTFPFFQKLGKKKTA